jgi:hypothetical protein
VPGLDRRSFSVRQNKMLASPVELSSQDDFFAFRSGIDEISIDLLLHLLDLLQHSPYGSRYPVEHSIRIIDELARVVG